ncbi:hypothetical protein SSBR45G_03390 [Bradyrhizobium sp. SSBR45G]|uniref:lipase/acyltransferase domain-containing protein n=1 Tax=unclassified Bradyrhizobium TaxID=2631580 RepID=UPI002342A33C|nr:MULTISPECIES: hypothetical protein [unclassified Bradyrhizobium]GLH75431.1 hypothetical protein SSBR45G_03390 [Bradyrhizobium sp. SSBR45G]GLH82782.1 hypothetical protein SSBR45R_02420 [Bradyrhizobium sp. SSBR45R]
METIILVPGITGSCLSLGETQVWPPKVEEIVWDGYHRVDDLLNPQVKATGIWAELPVFNGYAYPVYRPIMNKLDEIANRLQPKAERIDFYYDWRVDLWQSNAPFVASSEMLARRIAQAVGAGATAITLVCHSMGNLVARLVLESQRYRNEPWFGTIKRLIAVCGPHLGAATAQGQALGCEAGSLGLSRDDLRRIANNPSYPACFQCFPIPGTEVLLDTLLTPQEQDVYDPAVAGKYGLTASSTRAAATSWQQLDIAHRPSHVAYYLIAGTGLNTSNAYLYRGTDFVETIKVDGDGTVPVYSALAGSYSGKYSMPGDHVGILGTVQLSDALDNIFGLSRMRAFLMAEPGITINLHKHSFAPGEVMQLLIIPDTPTTTIKGRLSVSAAPRPGLQSSSAVKPALVAYGGGVPLDYQGPEITHISAQWTAPRLPGAYVMRFEGDTHQTSAPSSAVFFVNSHPGLAPLRGTP